MEQHREEGSENENAKENEYITSFLRLKYVQI